jgi:hypothetical protein
MEYGLLVGQLNSEGLGQIVPFNLRFGLFERPGEVVQVGPDGVPIPGTRKHTVALKEEVLQ